MSRLDIDGACHCGSALYSTQVDNPQTYDLRLGWRQGFCRSAMPWASDIRDIPIVPERERPRT